MSARVPAAASAATVDEALEAIANHLAAERPPRPDRDAYYMAIAEAARARACCVGSRVGAVIVRENRVISTGYNGTPTGFANCDHLEWGCVRCRDSQLIAHGAAHLASDQGHQHGRSLDKCICVHAEQNALLAAAKYGIQVEEGTLYSTLRPCFGCLKEAIQAGIVRIVFADEYADETNPQLRDMYDALAEHVDMERFSSASGEAPS